MDQKLTKFTMMSKYMGEIGRVVTLEKAGLLMEKSADFEGPAAGGLKADTENGAAAAVEGEPLPRRSHPFFPLRAL
jgi:hypothetical protein